MVHQTIDPKETVHDRTNDAALIQADDGKCGGIFRFNDPALGEVEFEKFDDARLLFGLWKQTGGYPWPPEDGHVPIDVATAGRAALAAFLLVGRGKRRETETVRDEMGLETTQAVWNYAKEVRWTRENTGSNQRSKQ